MPTKMKESKQPVHYWGEGKHSHPSPNPSGMSKKHPMPTKSGHSKKVKQKGDHGY